MTHDATCEVCGAELHAEIDEWKEQPVQDADNDAIRTNENGESYDFDHA